MTECDETQRTFPDLRIVPWRSSNIRCLNTFTQRLLMSHYKVMTGVDCFLAHEFLCVLTAACVWLCLHHSRHRPRAPPGGGRWACPEEAEQSLPWNHIPAYLAFTQLSSSADLGSPLSAPHLSLIPHVWQMEDVTYWGRFRNTPWWAQDSPSQRGTSPVFFYSPSFPLHRILSNYLLLLLTFCDKSTDWVSQF